MLLLIAAVLHAPQTEAGHAEPLTWTLDPKVSLPLLVLLLFYGTGWVRLHRRAGRGRTRIESRARPFIAGWLLLAGAIVSPLHAAGEVSFALHMVEHELIMLPAALLLVASRPGAVLMWGLPRPARRALRHLASARLWKDLTDPIVATALQAMVMVGWHAPRLFDLALREEGWHMAQHLSFIGSALLFWWAMLDQTRRGGRLLLAALCLFATSLIGAALGALMALAASPWYAAYADMGMTPFGLTPIEDQQLAGLVMWVPGGMFHALAALVLLGQALRQPQKFSTNA